MTKEELRKKISDAFDYDSSVANNGQMSVITEDSYSDLIDEIIEITEAYHQEKVKEDQKQEQIEADAMRALHHASEKAAKYIDKREIYIEGCWD